MNKRGDDGQNKFIKRKAKLFKEGEITMWDRIFLLLLIIGGINWGLIGIFQFDLVAFIFGGQAAVISRIIYTLVGISAVWCVSLFFREQELLEARS